jgi:transcriptional regulator with XRE-family HTH domain
MTSQITETEHVDVGERLRAIRRLRRVTLKTVAERADLSESFLSQVERGRANAASHPSSASPLAGVNTRHIFGRTGRRQPASPSRGTADLRSGHRLRSLTPRPLEHLR